MALLSYKHNLLFIHIFKNAGTSIRTLMSGTGCEEILTGHATAADVKQELGSEWDKLTSFAVIRNPFDWMLSLYNYIRAYENHFLHQEAMCVDLNEFIEFYMAYSKINPANKVHGRGKTISQYDFICADGIVIVNYVCKFEELQFGLNEIFSLKGIDLPPLPHLNITAGVNGSVGREAYNKKGIDLMIENYAKDFELGGYSKHLIVV